MGILKAFKDSVGGVAADQWLEVYYCDSLPVGTLALRGVRQVGQNSANTKGDENVISDGSVIIVNEGQCALVIEQGKIIADYREPGENKFHSDKTSSVFSKGGIKGMAKQTFDRFGYGGVVAVHQFVMYLNLKEQLGNEFYLSCPVRLVDRYGNLDFDATVSVSGMFSFKITDPVTFYKNVCRASTGAVYTASVMPQLMEEFKSVAIKGISELCESGVSPTDISKKTEELSELIKAQMTEKWAALRGFSAQSVAISSISVAAEDLGALQLAERVKMLTDPQMAAAALISAQADAMVGAANNPAGAAGAFIGVAGAGAVGGAFAESGASNPKLWVCKCGKYNTSEYCENCGAKRL